MTISFQKIRETYFCKEIHGCPGRFIIRDIHDASLFDTLAPREYTLPNARDPVVVAEIEGGGLISFKKTDGYFIHTLNTPEGFRRKLVMLGILIDGV